MPCQLVTGGCGFIGSCYVLEARRRGVRVVNLDKLTYAGNLANLAALQGDPEYVFVRGDIGNADLVDWLLRTFQPDAVVNFAAESHVALMVFVGAIDIKKFETGHVAVQLVVEQPQVKKVLGVTVHAGYRPQFYSKRGKRHLYKLFWILARGDDRPLVRRARQQ